MIPKLQTTPRTKDSLCVIALISSPVIVIDNWRGRVLTLIVKVSLSLFNIGIKILNFVGNERYIRLRVGMEEKFRTEFSHVISTTKFQMSNLFS